MHTDIIVLETLQLNDDSFPKLFQKIQVDCPSNDAQTGKFPILIAYVSKELFFKKSRQTPVSTTQYTVEPKHPVKINMLKCNIFET